MPGTKTLSTNILSKFLYALYQIGVPLGVALVLVVGTTLVVKRQDKYEAAQHVSHFDVGLFAATPIFAYLFSEALFGSGLGTLIFTGVLQGIYSVQNYEQKKLDLLNEGIGFVANMSR